MFSGREVAVLTVKVPSFGANISNHELQNVCLLVGHFQTISATMLQLQSKRSSGSWVACAIFPSCFVSEGGVAFYTSVSINTDFTFMRENFLTRFISNEAHLHRRRVSCAKKKNKKCKWSIKIYSQELDSALMPPAAIFCGQDKHILLSFLHIRYTNVREILQHKVDVTLQPVFLEPYLKLHAAHPLPPIWQFLKFPLTPYCRLDTVRDVMHTLDKQENQQAIFVSPVVFPSKSTQNEAFFYSKNIRNDSKGGTVHEDVQLFDSARLL